MALVTTIFISAAQNDTTGTVTVESKAYSIELGVDWGDGVLEYRGKKYPFSVRGLSVMSREGPRVIELDIAKVIVRGTVKKLKKLEDFDGYYVAADADAVAAVGGGVGGAVLKNKNGVEMILTASPQRVQPALAGRRGVVNVKLKQ